MRFKPLCIRFLFAFLAGLLLIGLETQGQEPASVKTPVAARRSLPRSYGKLPLSFEVNQGQTDRRVKFLSRGHGYTLFLTPTEAVLSLSKPVPQERPAIGPSGKDLNATKPAELAVLRIKLVGGNPRARLAAMEELPGKSNYFMGNDPKKWRTNVPNYGRVKVHDVYPGVDLMYYGNQRQLEEDFVVAPCADPRAITMAIAGAEKTSIDAQGELVIASPGGEVHLRKPVVYQRAGGVQHEIAGGYKLKGENRVGFELGEYDVRQPLVIDPVLAYSTYLGGSNNDQGLGIAVDSSGNSYVTGNTSSTNFPGAGSSPIQSANAGSADVFVAKINAAGSALIYSTYLGGNSDDAGQAIAVDSSGNVYVTGGTRSGNYPTTAGAFQTTFGGPAGENDAFVTKLNPTGAALVYSTYLGGSGGDVGVALAVDSAGNAYVAGITSSTNFPTTPGAFQTSCLAQRCTPFLGTGAGFVTKLNSSGTALAYSTYLSGSNGDENGSNGIAVDPSGNAYVAGATNSSDFPTTPGAFQSVGPKNGGICGPNSPYVTKLNTSGTGLVWSTYLAGSGSFPPCTGIGNEEAHGIAIDSAGNAYVTGNTSLANFPTTAGAFQATLGGSRNAFVTKLNAAGSALVYSSYLGGSNNDFGQGIAVDFSGNTYMTGYTSSTNFPTTSGAIQTTFGGGTDAFVTMVNPNGSGLVFSTYLGGNDLDYGFAIAVDSSGNAYVTGLTASTNFLTTPGALQTAFGGGSYDAFVAKIGPNQPPVAVITGTPTGAVECTSPSGASVSLDGSSSHDPDGDTSFTYQWQLDSVSVGTNASLTVTVPFGVHTISLTVTDSGGLSNTASVNVTVQDTTPPNLSVSLSPSMLWPPNHSLIPMTANITVSDTCDANPSVVLVSITANEPLAPGDIQDATFGTDDRSFELAATRLGSGNGRIYTVTYKATDHSGNSTTVNAQVIVPHDQGN